MTQDATRRPSPTLTHAALAFCACFVDVVCVLGVFHTFTAFITGSFVLLWVDLVQNHAQLPLKLIVIFSFTLFSLIWHALMHRMPGGGSRHLRLFLLVEAALLAGFMATALAGAPLTRPTDPHAMAAIVLSAGAMALQTQITIRVLKRNMATTLMTINTLKMLGGFHDSVFDPSTRDKLPEHRGLLVVILSFGLGGLAGALCMTTAGFAALAVPVAVLVVLALRVGGPDPA